VITPARLRHLDLIDLLGRRLGLSSRQAECVALVHAGLRNREVASRLGIAEVTVGQYLVAIYETLGVRTRSQVVALVDELVLREPAADTADDTADGDRE